MNRITGFLCVVFVLLSLSIGKVNANGQIILDRIEPVKDDKVTFLDPLFTNSGAIENVETGSIAVTRQHELRVEVPDVLLTGKEGGVDLGGSLGVLLSSAYRDIAFEAANGHVSLNANQFHFTASQNVVVESQSGDVTVNSHLETTLHGPSVNIYAREGLNIDTDGNVQFTAGADLVVATDDTLTFQVQGVIDIEAEKGSFYNTAGGNIVISSGDYIILDGPRGVSLDTEGQLSLVGAVAVELTGVTTDVVTKGNIAVSFPNVNVYGRDGALIGGKAVNLTSRGDLSVTGLGPQAEILFDFGNYLEFNAVNGAINVETVGEATDISFWTRVTEAFISDDFFVNTQTNIRLGGNETDLFSISTNTITWNSDNSYISSDADLFTSSVGQTKYTSRDMFSRSHSYYETALVSGITVNENSLSILSRAGDPNHVATIESDGSISSTSSNSFYFGAYTIDGFFTNSQTYNVRDSTFTSICNSDRDIILEATTAQTFSVEDAIDITTKNAIFEGTAAQTIRVEDFTINSNEFTSLSSFHHLQTTLDITLTSGQEVNFIGTTLNDISGGVVRIDADDNILLQVGDLSFTSALANKVDMQDHIFYNIDDMTTFTAKSTIRYDLSDSLYLKTSNFNLQGTNGITWSISEWDGVFGSLSVSSTDVATFNTKGLGFIDIYSGHNLDFLAVLGIVINTGDSISSRTQEETRFQAGSALSFTTLGDFHIQGSGDMLWSAKNNILFGEGKLQTSDSTINSDILRVGAGTNFQITSLDQVNFFQTDSGVYAQTDIQLFAVQGTLTISNQAEPADITLFGHVIDSTTSQDSTWSAGREFGFTSVDFLLSADDSIDITTGTSTIEGFTASFIGSDSSFVQGDTLYVVTGYDDYLNADADRSISYTARETQITSSSNAQFSSTGGAVSITSKQELTFQSVLGTSNIFSGGPITAKASAIGGNFGISSAEDLGFFTNTGRISHSAANTNFNTGFDFHVISQKADPTLTKDCAIEFSTHGREAVFNSEVGEVFLSGWDKFHVQSIIGAVGSFGDIEVRSNGNTFFESDENALAYFARGNDGFSATTNSAHFGNIELLAGAADVWFYGSQGFKFDSKQDFYILADDGMNITAAKTDPAAGTTPTISISSSDLSTIDGARGLIFVAGLDAPIVKADFSASSTQFTNLETYDQLHVRAAGGHFKANSLSSISILTEEASEAKFSSARDTIMTANQDTTYTTIDGDQYFNSNAFGINVKATEALRVSTTDGPIQLRATAGLFSMDGGNWEFTSQMDSRFVSLGFARLNAQAGLRLISTGVNEGDCVLLQTYRNLDSIFVNSKNAMTITATTNELTPKQTYAISTIGDNIDFYAGNSLSFSSEDILWVGNHTSPEIRITAGAGALGTGFTSSSEEGTFVRSQNTITAVANSFNYQVENAVVESTGLIYIISQTGANNWIANDNILMNSEFWVADAVNNHVIDGSGSATVEWASEGTGIGDRVELHTTDVVTTESDSINYQTSILYKMTLQGDYTAESAGDISFQNIRPDDVNYPKPFFSDLQSERGKQIFTVGDFWLADTPADILVELGRFGTPFTTNFTTGDFQQSAITFHPGGAINWNAMNYELLAPHEGSSVKVQSTSFSLSSLSIDLLSQVPSKTGGYVHVDPLDSNINFKSLGSTNIQATGDLILTAGPNVLGGSQSGSIIQSSLAGTTYDFPIWAVTLISNLQDSLIEFTSSESTVTMGNAGTATLNIDSTQLPSPFTNNLDDLYRNLYESDADTNFDYADWSVTAGTGRVSTTAGTVYMTTSSLFSATAAAGKFVLDTNSFESDISVTSSGPIQITPSAAAVFTSSDLLNLHATTTGSYTGEVTNFSVQWGDISFDMSTDLTFTGSDLASFVANGFDSDNSRAITIQSNLLTLTTAADLHFEAKQAIEINSPDSPLVFTGGEISLKATNYLSPVVLNSLSNPIVFTAPTVDWQAGAVATVESHLIDISTDTLVLSASVNPAAIRDAGILFDTNPVQNMKSAINLSGTTADLTSHWLGISSDFTTADGGGIEFTSSGVGANFLVGATRNLNFLNKHGDMRWGLATVNVANAGAAVEFSGGAISWDLGTGTMTSTAGTNVRTGGSIFFNSQELQMNVDTLNLDTKEFGRSNDIYFRSTGTFGADPVRDLTFLGAGSDTDIVIEADNGNAGVIRFDSDVSTNWFTRSGISVTTSESTTSTTFDIHTDQDFSATTSEYKANIFFQSDRDTVFRAPNGEIRHANYHSRLGFFSVTPATIRLINLQGIEGCVRARLCASTGSSDAVWTTGIANVGSVATQLHGLIRSWGLVDWTTNMDITSLCCP